MNPPADKPSAEPASIEASKLGALRLICWLLVAGPVVFLTVLFLSLPAQPRQAVGPILILCLAGLSLFLIGRRQTRAAALLLVYGGWGAIAVHSIASGGGIHTPQLAAMPLGIMLSGWLLGRQHAIAVTVLAVLLSLGLALLEQGGLAGPARLLPPLLIWLPRAVVAVGVCLLTLYIVQTYEERIGEVHRLGEALDEEGTQLRLLVDNVPAMIAYNDTDLKIRFANRRYQAFFGLDPAQGFGQSIRDVIGAEAFEAAQPLLQKTLAGEKLHYRGQRRNAAGELRTLEVETVPDRDHDGKVRGAYALIRDITEQVRAEEKFAKIFHATPLPATITRLDTGVIVDVNPAACRSSGWLREEMLGQTSLDLGLWPDPEQRARAYELVRREGALHDFEITYRIRSGELRTTLASAEILELDGVPCVLTLIHDVTERKRIEDELLRSEQKFSRVFQHSPIPISITRMADGRFIDVNEAWTRLFGWTRAQVVGRNSFDLGIWPNPEDRQAWITAVQRPARLESYETKLRHKDGRILSILFSSEMVELDGEPCLLALSIDLTEQKKVEAALVENEKRLSEAQRIGHFGSWELDLARDAFCWSEEIEHIYEIQVEQGTVSYADFLNTVPPEEREAFDRSFGEAIRARRSGEFSYRLRMRDGRIKHVHVNFEVQLGPEGTPTKTIGTTQDITEQVLAREEIQRLNASLESRVQARTAELTAANRELESFAYSISHDLRAPLRGIDGFSHLLAEEYAEKLDDTGRGYLERVRRAAQRMGELIDDILELSRVTRQDMRRITVDLSRIAAEVIEERARVEPDRKVEITIAPGCTAQGDPQLLRVLMQNLLENAWKYSRRAEPARIAFGQETRDGETVFFVRDNGVGFDMQYAERLFAPFQRLHRPEEFEGSGIGLATVARVTHRHGGRVWAEAETGKGATFRFTLG